jgi:pimeloyl-ACP methyl ester carboxylesterase
MTDFALLHGGGQGSWVWDETIAAMQAQSGGTARCLALDIPGCGTKRARDTGAVAFEEIAPELVADIEAAGMRDVVLVGHSQAGSTLPGMAKLRPGLFRRLVYLTCTAPEPGRTSTELMGEGLHGQSETEVGWPVDPATHTIEQRLRAMFCNDMSTADADAFYAKIGKDMWPMSTYSQREWRYDHLIGAPSTFIMCLQDMALPPPWQLRFAQRFHAGRIVRLDAGHQAMNTRPQALAELLLAEAAG